MSKAKNEIHESLSSIILFLRLFKTVEVGELVRICQLLEQQPLLYEDKTFSRMIAQFIYHVNEQNKKNHTQQEYLALMVTQSLIFNLYRQNNRQGMNSSIYSNSLLISSTSQIGVNDQSVLSIKHHDSIQDHFTGVFATFIQDLISDAQLFKKIKQMAERGARRSPEGHNNIQRFIDVFLNTLQYILNKEGKLDKNREFQAIKQTLGNKNTKMDNHIENKNKKSIINEVNKIIFSSKLNRIVFLLEEAHEKIYLSLIHIYFANFPDNEDRKGKMAKYFSGVSYSGEDMMLNLSWAYVESIRNKNQLFESSKNPLFRLIQSNLYCFYMNIFRSFNQVVQKCCKYDFNTAIQFYKIAQTIIMKDLTNFIQMIPEELIEYLRETYRIVLSVQSRGSKKDLSSISSIALTGVKKLLIYSLLVKPSMIQTYYSQGFDLDKYEDACNHIISLFFKSSIKKYQAFPEESEFVSRLIKSISGLLDSRILGNMEKNQQEYLDDFEKSIGIRNYLLEDPILNHDYEVLWSVIQNIEFTPKDLKDFQMHKKQELTQKLDVLNMMPENFNNTIAASLNIFSPKQLSSPMHRAKKESLEFNQSIEYLEHLSEQQSYPQKQQIDFLTWMTVGGNRNYESRPTTLDVVERRKRKEPKQFVTFPRQKIRQISSLYEEYKRILS